MDLQQNLNEKSSKHVSNRFTITQFVVYDQFSDTFLPLIEKYQTAKSICGYTAVTNIRFIHEFGIEEGLKQIKSNQKLLHLYIEDMMEFVLNQRKQYCLTHKEVNPKNYYSDWVANFELSDYLKKLHIPNIYFFRNVAFKYEEQFKETKNEERERIIRDETQFKEDLYFIYYPFDDKYISMKDFQISNNHLYIFDTLGHYICGWVNSSKKGKKVIILETIPFRDSKESEVLLRFFKK